MKLSTAADATTSVAVGAAVMACCLTLRLRVGLEAETPGMAGVESQATRAKGKGVPPSRPIVIVIAVQSVVMAVQVDEMKRMRVVGTTDGRTGSE